MTGNNAQRLSDRYWLTDKAIAELDATAPGRRDVLVFNVNGTPGAQGSKRHVGHGVMVESSKKVKPWRSDVKAAAEHATGAVAHFDPWTPFDGPVHATITFRFPRPKGHYRTGRNAHLLRDNAPHFVTSRACGDADKLARSTLDALTAAGVFTDDSLVARLIVDKVYCLAGEIPGATIMVRPLTLDAA
jgi:crossover junction endodeoxyribonuclease RusA